ncbi:hypothetical protein JCM19037_2138 [Geomicrobium sp. JCM 19037]|uniref:hypothetical protein n=1 Tax=Geomicrobium sp. JCM 19037 TaxID=1460634 RepID=UPI00045F3353|nr:hypothetical protein [Geomicrobium sp. JCM 19037]GAK03791.1 hypothetical protein JCM19037_2138 [Geomicrobium sp. JCM 19037]
MFKKYASTFVLASAALIVSACGNGDDSAGGEVDDLFVTIAAGGTSGVYYPIAGAMASVYETRGTMFPFKQLELLLKMLTYCKVIKRN